MLNGLELAHARTFQCAAQRQFCESLSSPDIMLCTLI